MRACYSVCAEQKAFLHHVNARSKNEYENKDFVSESR